MHTCWLRRGGTDMPALLHDAHDLAHFSYVPA